MNCRRARLINILFFISNFGVALGFLIKGQFPKIANPAVITIFYIGVILLERFTTFKLKNYIRVLLYITLTGHSLVGEYFGAYYSTAFFDNALHFLGSFSFALFAYDLMNSFIKVRSSHPALFIFIIVSIFGISLGTIFELLEFFLDLSFKEKNQFGLIDTDWDLFYDVIGSFFAGIFIVLKDSRFCC